MKKRRGDKLASWAFLTPTLVFLGITALVPLLYSIYLSPLSDEAEPAQPGAGVRWPG